MNIMALFNALPGACAQGLIWGIMAIGVYITYKILDVADLTVDGTMCYRRRGLRHDDAQWLQHMDFASVRVHRGYAGRTYHGSYSIRSWEYPAILAGILTQLALYSINLRILGSANQAISVRKYNLLISLMYIPRAIWISAVFVVALIVILYWFFGTELGSSLRATGCNQHMARAQGINTNFNKVLGLMLSNGIVALASALYSQYQGFADINMGRGAIVIGLAAVIIGDVVFGKIFRNFAIQAAGRGAGRGHVLSGNTGGAVAGPEHRTT